jgi:quinol monooxygenase YgiN
MLKTLLTLCVLLSTLTALAADNKNTIQLSKMTKDKTAMMKFGMQAVLTAQAGKGAELAELMLEASRLVSHLSGCEIYIVQRAIADADKILITEVWADQTSHQASLTDPAVRELIGRARPMIAGMEHQLATPVGGKGL